MNRVLSKITITLGLEDYYENNIFYGGTFQGWKDLRRRSEGFFPDGGQMAGVHDLFGLPYESVAVGL